MITLECIANVLLILATILFIGCYISWALSMVEHKNDHTGFWVFVILLVGGIFGLIACLLLPDSKKKDTDKTELLSD